MTFLSTKLNRIGAAAALALGASGAFAQSSVTISGLVDMSVGRFEYSGPTTTTNGASAQPGKMSTSYWGLNTKEDLGSGYATGVSLESFFRPNNGDTGRFTGDTQFARNANVYVSGGFGKVSLGRSGTPLFVSTLMFNPFGDSFGFSPAIIGYFQDNWGAAAATGTRRMVEGDTGWNSSVAWNSPIWAGFSVHAQATVNGKASNQAGNNFGAAIRYSNGPFAAALTGQSVKAEPLTDGKQTVWQIAASYDFQVVKIFGQYGQTKTDADTTLSVGTALAGTKGKLAQAGLSAPVGAGKVLAAYGYTKLDKDESATLSDSNRKIATLGYDYFLSKRTDVYGVYMYDKLSTADSANTFAVGIRHRF